MCGGRKERQNAGWCRCECAVFRILCRVSHAVVACVRPCVRLCFHATPRLICLLWRPSCALSYRRVSCILCAMHVGCVVCPCVCVLCVCVVSRALMQPPARPCLQHEQESSSSILRERRGWSSTLRRIMGYDTAPHHMTWHDTTERGASTRHSTARNEYRVDFGAAVMLCHVM